MLKEPNLKDKGGFMPKFALIITMVFSSLAIAATVTGYVHDAYGRPMDETSVTIDGLDLNATCNSADGSFTLANVPTGSATIIVLYHESEIQSIDINVSASGENYTRIDLPIVCENGSCKIVR